MRRSTKISITTFASLMLVALLSGAASAQHLISSKAGFVNRADGKVYILRSASEDGEKGRASLGTQMKNGDRLSTEEGSYAEVLLNPGSYLRLNEETEVRAVNTSLSEVRFELIKGSVNVEVGEVDKKAPIEILTPQGALFIAKDGLSRIDARDGLTAVAVRQGEILLGSRESALANKAFKVGRGKVAQLTGSPQPMLAKLDKDAIDKFDTWCFTRAQTLMAANQMALRQSRTSSSLSYGWIYDPFYSCYTFIPRRGAFWSPYGFGFYNGWGSCWSCGYWPYGGYYGGYPSGGGGGGVMTPNLPPRVIAGNDRAPIRRETPGRQVDTGSIFDSGGGMPARGVSMPSSSSAPAPVSVSPAPARGDTGGSRPSMPSRP